MSLNIPEHLLRDSRKINYVKHHYVTNSENLAKSYKFFSFIRLIYINKFH